MKIGPATLFIDGRRAGTVTDLRVMPVSQAPRIAKDKCSRCSGDHPLSRCTWPNSKGKE